MGYVLGNGETYVGATVGVQITLEMPHGTAYCMLDVELSVPYANGSAVANICRAEITHVGDNLHGFTNGGLLYHAK